MFSFFVAFILSLSHSHTIQGILYGQKDMLFRFSWQKVRKQLVSFWAFSESQLNLKFFSFASLQIQIKFYQVIFSEFCNHNIPKWSSQFVSACLFQLNDEAFIELERNLRNIIFHIKIFAKKLLNYFALCFGSAQHVNGLNVKQMKSIILFCFQKKKLQNWFFSRS